MINRNIEKITKQISKFLFFKTFFNKIENHEQINVIYNLMVAVRCTIITHIFKWQSPFHGPKSSKEFLCKTDTTTTLY